MEVDRVAPMGGVRQEADPTWTRAKMRRRRFTEDVPENAEPEAGQDAGEPEGEEKKAGGLDVMA
ncbi:MAG: hypothetical protein WB974_10770 [Acidobacteriaceae bacterium]